MPSHSAIPETIALELGSSFGLAGSGAFHGPSLAKRLAARADAALAADASRMTTATMVRARHAADPSVLDP
jgi:hypothetical protein